MIVSKDIDTIIWRYIHNSNMKSLNTEYSRYVYKDCDIYPKECVCPYLCRHCTMYRNFEYNYRNLPCKYSTIYGLKAQKTAFLPKNY